MTQDMKDTFYRTPGGAVMRFTKPPGDGFHQVIVLDLQHQKTLQDFVNALRAELDTDLLSVGELRKIVSRMTQPPVLNVVKHVRLTEGHIPVPPGKQFRSICGRKVTSVRPVDGQEVKTTQCPDCFAKLGEHVPWAMGDA